MLEDGLPRDMPTPTATWLPTTTWMIAICLHKSVIIKISQRTQVKKIQNHGHHEIGLPRGNPTPRMIRGHPQGEKSHILL